ncbi:hypothetical protein CRG98_009565 [Punica granatum]|uniref:Uncharacterized protein n=1 Tax=Punica granatum TaxID=22663 RepID=A0A2I0KNP8_PUNGR|nr:hypothetical protein CRG98_009565 [Punica granatum]
MNMVTHHGGRTRFFTSAPPSRGQTRAPPSREPPPVDRREPPSESKVATTSHHRRQDHPSPSLYFSCFFFYIGSAMISGLNKHTLSSNPARAGPAAQPALGRGPARIQQQPSPRLVASPAQSALIGPVQQPKTYFGPVRPLSAQSSPSAQSGPFRPNPALPQQPNSLRIPFIYRTAPILLKQDQPRTFKFVSKTPFEFKEI